MSQSDDHFRRMRRRNRITLGILTSFVMAIFFYSIIHIGREARPAGADSMNSYRP